MVDVKKEYMARCFVGRWGDRSPGSATALPTPKNSAAQTSKMPSPVMMASLRGVRGVRPNPLGQIWAPGVKGVPHSRQAAEVSSLSFPQYSQRVMSKVACQRRCSGAQHGAEA